MVNVTLNLKPFWDGDRPTRLNIGIAVSDFNLKKGESILSFNMRAVNRCFNKLITPFLFSDDEGEIDCTYNEEIYATHILRRNYLTQRDTRGIVKLKYTVAIEQGKSNPVFDLGNEPYGATGTGMVLFPDFPIDRLHLTLCWDFSASPNYCTGVSTFGRGDIKKVISGNDLQGAAVSFGKLRWTEKNNFGFYWIDNPEFDGEKIGASMSMLFPQISKFFLDGESDYRIITRRGIDISIPFGGTALYNSYVWLYDEKNPPDPEELVHLFSHEAVHNFVTLGTPDEPFGLTTWYTEGAAEYYSALLPFRYGLFDRKQLLDLLNSRCRDYYQNPRHTFSNLENGALLMQDNDATTVPYGRGFFYLTAVDKAIRIATNGDKSVDDVVLEIISRQKAGLVCTNDTWLELTGALTGHDMTAEFEAMARGEDFIPAALCYGEDFQVFPTYEKNKKGEDYFLYLYR